MDRLTRRTALSALAAVVLAPAAGGAARATTRSSLRLHRAIALHDRADAACKRFDDENEAPAREAWCAALAAYPTEPPPPHQRSATAFININGDTVRLSTDGIGSAAVARRAVGDPSWADMGDEDWRQAHREIVAAHDRRDAVIDEQAARRKAFEAQTRAEFRIDAISARSESLDDRRYRLWQAAIATPAAALADVVTKLDFASRINGDGDMEVDVFAAVSADIRRLALQP